MLKLLGCLFIFAASSGMAYSLVLGLYSQIRQTELLLRLVTAVEGEVAYSRSPLPELLSKLAGHLPEPYQELLTEASRQMEDNREADIPALWTESCVRFQKQFSLPQEAYEVLLSIGEVFSYTSLESSLQLLQLGKKRLDGAMQRLDAEFSGKRKLYCCLCYMAGFSCIILLL
ncbi:MAG: stage III sporulation protein AB [Eubacterium sp.]|nr:stage III sporulation protein AB [Eubacterium sp.]